MGPLSQKQRPGFKSYVLAVALVCGALGTSALAQDDTLLEDTELVSKKESKAEKLSRLRQKIEQDHERLVQKKIEKIRKEEKIKLDQKLKKAFSGQMSNLDTVSTRLSAPQRVVAPAPEALPIIGKKVKKNRIIPTLGLTNISAEGADSYETELTAGINFESKLTKRFAVGIGFGYSTMKINDINPNTNYGTLGTFGTFGTGCTGFGCPFGVGAITQGREMSYRQMDLNVDGKYFITPDSKIKPFVGLGIGYRRANLKYTENDPYFNQVIGGFGTTAANSEYSSNYVTGTVSGGADVAFTNVIGARLQLAYTKGLTGGSNTSNTNNQLFYDYNQIGLENTGRALENADFGSLSAGLIIGF